MEPYLDQAADYIDKHLRITNVLVHCMAGVSRSVTLVTAYLMKYRSMALQDALNYVRSRRPVVRFHTYSGKSKLWVHATTQSLL
jgi:protein-tyrosine phosphatase